MADIAAQLLVARPQPGLDAELVHVGCLLHDIGVYRLAADEAYIRHGVLGEAILRAEDLPEALCLIPSHHTGVGLTRRAIIARNLPLPHQDYLADTPEEALVMYADKFHSKSNPPHFNTFNTYRAYVAQFDPENPTKFDALADQFGHPDLAPLAAKYGHLLNH